MTEILRAYDCTEMLESGCILSGPSRAQSTFNIPWLTQVSCVGVMDQYLLIRATLCVPALKRCDELCVIIAVFSVNHASGAAHCLSPG